MARGGAGGAGPALLTRGPPRSHPGRRHRAAAAHAGEDLPAPADAAERADHHAAPPRRPQPQGLPVGVRPLPTAPPPPTPRPCYSLLVLRRLLHADRRALQNAVRNVLDGELLNRYLYLSTMERGELAKKIGTTPDIVSPAPPSCPAPPPRPARPHSPAPLPADPGRPAGDRARHRPLLDSQRPPPAPPFCTEHKEKDVRFE